MQIITLLLIALFIEAIVTAVKPLWSKDGERMSVAEIVCIFIGVVLAVSCKLNMLSAVDGGMLPDAPVWVNYIFYVMTGIALGRGPSFIWDLWERLRTATESDNMITKDIETSVEHTVTWDVDENGEPDLNVENWSFDQVKAFCKLNSIDTTGCVTREDYENALVRGGRVSDQPPTPGGE